MFYLSRFIHTIFKCNETYYIAFNFFRTNGHNHVLKNIATINKCPITFLSHLPNRYILFCLLLPSFKGFSILNNLLERDQ